MDPADFPVAADDFAEEYQGLAKANNASVESKACIAIVDGERHLVQDEYEKSVSCGRDAIKIWKEIGQSKAGALADATRLAAKALIGLNRHDEALKLSEEGLAMCKKSNDSMGEAKMLLTIADVRWPLGDAEEVLNYAEQAVGIFRKQQTAPARKMHATALVTLAWVHLTLDEDTEADANRAMTAAKLALSISEEVGYKRGNAAASHALAAANASIGSMADCLRFADQALDAYLELGDQRQVMFQWLCSSRWNLESKHHLEALSAAEEALECCRALGADESAALMAIFRACNATNKQRKASRIVKDALAEAEDSGDRRREAAVLSVLYHVQRSCGKSRDALMSAESAMAIYQELGQSNFQAKQLGAISSLHYSMGEYDKALSAGEEALPLVKQSGTTADKIEVMHAMVDSHIALKNLDEAMEVVEDLKDHFKDIDDREGNAAAIIVLCKMAIADDRLDDAIRYASDAQALFHEDDDAKGEAQALQYLCEIYSKRGEHKAAIRAAEQARVHFQELEDEVGEATMLYHLAQNAALLAIREGARVEENARASRTCREALAKASKTVQVAVRQARNLGDMGKQLLGCALCTLSQVEMLGGRLKAALEAADEGIMVFRSALDEANEASALLLSADALRRTGEYKDAQEAAVEALRMFQESENEAGAAQAEELLSFLRERLRPAARPSPAAPAGPTAPQAALAMVDHSRQEAEQAPDQATRVSTRERGPGLDMALLDEESVVAKLLEVAERVTDAEEGEIELDTPLMEAGLTSNSAILLRDELMGEMPGLKLPVTLVFDYPSISGMAELIMESLSKLPA